MTEGTENASAESNARATIECPFCSEQILPQAKKCKHCGETIDVTMRRAEEVLRSTDRGTNVFMNAAVSAGPAYIRAPKSKGTAIILALFLGGLGGHKFYLDRAGQGILYVIFCWTFIPSIIALIEAIVYAASSEESFHIKYG